MSKGKDLLFAGWSGLKLTRRITGLLQWATTGVWGRGPRRSRCWTCPHVFRTIPCSHSLLRKVDQGTTDEATECGCLSQGQPYLNLARIPQGVLNKKLCPTHAPLQDKLGTLILKNHILFDPLILLIRVNLWLFLHNCLQNYIYTFYTFVHVPVKIQSILYGLLFSTVLDGLLRLTFF